MSLRLIHLFAALGLAVGSAGEWFTQEKKDDEKKTDAQIAVKEGTELTLTPVEVKPAEKPDAQGRYTVTVKAKEPTKVKMPAQAYSLGVPPQGRAGQGRRHRDRRGPRGLAADPDADRAQEGRHGRRLAGRSR
jgi:hypothetical protein